MNYKNVEIKQPISIQIGLNCIAVSTIPATGHWTAQNRKRDMTDKNKMATRPISMDTEMSRSDVLKQNSMKNQRK